MQRCRFSYCDICSVRSSFKSICHLENEFSFSTTISTSRRVHNETRRFTSLFNVRYGDTRENTQIRRRRKMFTTDYEIFITYAVIFDETVSCVSSPRSWTRRLVTNISSDLS